MQIYQKVSGSSFSSVKSCFSDKFDFGQFVRTTEMSNFTIFLSK